MPSTRTLLALSGALTLLLLAGCASLPDDLGQEYSEGSQSPETTFLGTLIAEAPEAADPGQSGVELLSHPEEAFRTRFYIANLAEESLDLQYYLWKDDLAGALLLWSALDAADRGVRVRFLIDDIYHAGRDDLYALMDTHENFEVRVFNPMANRGLARYLNYAANREQLNRRMHNKIFLADNAVAVLGGRNIGNDYFGIDTKANFFDLDVLTTGAGTREAGAAFDEYWNSRWAVPIRVLHDPGYDQDDLDRGRKRLEAYLEELNVVPYELSLNREAIVNDLREWRDQLTWTRAQVIVDPLERFDGKGQSAFIATDPDSRAPVYRELIMQSAYLIPSQEGLDYMRELVERGVRVRLMTNSLMSNNHITAHSGYLKYRKAILETGAELHELRADAALRERFRANQEEEVPAGIHTKSFVVDREQALIGSFNLDPRSRELNSEIGLLVDSAEFAGEVAALMDTEFDLRNSYRLFLDDKGRLRWESVDDEGQRVVFTHDPHASAWKRGLARFLSWLPIEQEL
jgi:putative cardiolipin synthase